MMQSSFAADRLARLAEIEGTHFWFRGRRQLVRTLLRGRLGRSDTLVLDAGCGTGATMAELASIGQNAVGLDSLPRAVELTKSRCPGQRVELGDVTSMPFSDATFDGVLLLDVLEHVDDRRTLAEVARVLRPGGFVAVTVPACPWLWSRRDELAGHRRRYRRRSLEQVLRDAGFRIEHVTHYQLALLPAFAVSRLLGRWNASWLRREEQIPPRLGHLLGAVSGFEARLAARWRLPAGSSVVALGIRS